MRFITIHVDNRFSWNWNNLKALKDYIFKFKELEVTEDKRKGKPESETKKEGDKLGNYGMESESTKTEKIIKDLHVDSRWVA